MWILILLLVGCGPTERLDARVSALGMFEHLEALQEIADDHEGNRAAFTEGYDASVAYVTERLELAGYTVTHHPFTLRHPGTGEEVTQVNVVAEAESGPADRVIHLGAPLDSAPEGPGINGGGSGAALVLEIAIQWAGMELEPENRLRFTWWGAEAPGQVGSGSWIQEHELPMAYLHFDAVGSPNGMPFVYDGVGALGAYDPPAGAGAIEGLFAEWFRRAGIPHGGVDPRRPADAQRFFEAGVPVGGLYAGGPELKSAEEAAVFGGIANAPYDPCHDQPCDHLGNLDPFLFDILGAAAAHVTQELALWGEDL